MVLKVYQKYLIKEFLLISLKITFIFLVLGLIMGLLEELNFFSEYDVNLFYPIYLVFLNVPSLIYEIFPFIFLLSSQFLFLNLLDSGELNTFKNNGLNNMRILRLVTLLSFVIGLFIIVIFYNLAAIMKFEYLDIKKNFTKDNKYLATITENGLWIKDEVNNKINFINANKFTINTLHEVDFIQLNNKFEFSGRHSKIKSDGYIDRASSNLKSYFFQGLYKNDKRLFKRNKTITVLPNIWKAVRLSISRIMFASKFENFPDYLYSK